MKHGTLVLLKISFLLGVGLAAHHILIVLRQDPFSSIYSENHDTSSSIASSKSVEKKGDDLLGTVAYMISVTHCDEPFRVLDGAAILRQSILRHASGPESGSRYGSKLYAVVHPEAEADCAALLRSHPALQYTVLVKDTPLNVSDIQGELLRTTIKKTGCCGERELIKLYAYTLVDHPIVVHVDVDTFFLRPMDELFDAMLFPDTANTSAVRTMFNQTLPSSSLDAYITRDYSMVRPTKKHVGLQGGFFIIKPNRTTFDEYVNLVLEGNYRHSGWGGIYGGYWGAATIQGLVSYYYDHFYPHRVVELDSCVYNNMAQDPRMPETNICRTGRDECEDCRLVNVEEIRHFHFTFCQKPWKCVPHPEEMRPLCHTMHEKWFQLRKEMEEELGWRTMDGNVSGTGGQELSLWKEEQFQGYCHHSGFDGYMSIDFS